MQHTFHHRLHMRQLTKHFCARRSVVNKLALQPQPGDRRSQIVAHSGKHAGAIIDQHLDVFAHLIERTRRYSNFLWPTFRNRGDFAVRIEILRRRGEARHQRPRQSECRPNAEKQHTDKEDNECERGRAEPEERRRCKLRGNELAVLQPDSDAFAGPG